MRESLFAVGRGLEDQGNGEGALPEYACMVDQVVVVKADFSGVVFIFFFFLCSFFFFVSICISRLWTNMSRKSLHFNEFVYKIFEEEEEGVNEDICTEIRKTVCYLVPKGSLGLRTPPIVTFMSPELPKKVHAILLQRQIVRLLTGDRYEDCCRVCDKWSLVGG